MVYGCCMDTVWIVYGSCMKLEFRIFYCPFLDYKNKKITADPCYCVWGSCHIERATWCNSMDKLQMRCEKSVIQNLLNYLRWLTVLLIYSWRSLFLSQGFEKTTIYHPLSFQISNQKHVISFWSATVSCWWRAVTSMLYRWSHRSAKA